MLFRSYSASLHSIFMFLERDLSRSGVFAFFTAICRSLLLSSLSFLLLVFSESLSVVLSASAISFMQPTSVSCLSR